MSTTRVPWWCSMVRELRALLFSWIFFGILPTTFWFQLVRAIAHLWRFDATPSGVAERVLELQVSSMTSRQSSLLTYMASNWKRHLPLSVGGVEFVVARMQWSKVDSTKWCTLGSLKCFSHSEVAKALSRWGDILLFPSFMLHQVKSGPQYPRSLKPLEFTTWQKPSIWL